jgi:DNA-binding IclR family transcriptional regulator
VALLRCFDGVSGTISLTELAERTGLRVSTAHRIVRALVRGDLLGQDPLTEQ